MRFYTYQNFDVGKFDMPVLSGYLFNEFRRRGMKVNVINKDGCLISVTVENVCIFKDAIRFTSPCSLQKYLTQNGVQDLAKTIFPHGYIKTTAQLDETSFPPHEAFYSALKRTNVTLTEYETARSEFNRRKELNEGHPEKMHTFRNWLEHYNLLDCFPLSCAINNSFQNYFDIFGMDPTLSVSLASYAHLVQMRQYASDAPLSHSFCSKTVVAKHTDVVESKEKDPDEYTDSMFEDSDSDGDSGDLDEATNVTKKRKVEQKPKRVQKFDFIRQKFRSSLFGGIVNCYHRMTDLTGKPGLPSSTQFALNGDKFTKIVFLDFNAMYLWSQKQPMPTTPGLHLEPKKLN